MRRPAKPASRRRKTWAITATDDDRCRRSEIRFGGPLELRYRDGELILSRGDIVLLAAPLAGPPTDVFLEGRATVQGIVAGPRHRRTHGAAAAASRRGN